MIKKIKIIAEIGVNHNGDTCLAKELVRKAKKTGADIVKFQFFNADTMVKKGTKSAKYQINNTGHSSQYDLLQELELSITQMEEIKNYCDKIKIEFLCTAFSADDLKSLLKLGMKKIKIPSGEISNKLLLLQAASSNKEIYLSTGMSDYMEVKRSFSFLKKRTKKRIYLLHCTSLYPAPSDSLNLKFLYNLKNNLTDNIGYSDHSMGTLASCLAVSLGAKVIEKHFTLDKSLKGPDHKASLDEKEFKVLVEKIRETESMLGEKSMKPDKRETSVKLIVRKSWYAKKFIKKGEILNKNNIILKRPLSFLSGWEVPYGKKIKINIKKGNPIKKTDLM